MTNVIKKTAVKGGTINRDSATGRFRSVVTKYGTFKESPRSVATTKEVSARRSAALKRLADR